MSFGIPLQQDLYNDRCRAEKRTCSRQTNFGFVVVFQGRLSHIWFQKWDPNAHTRPSLPWVDFFVFLSVPCSVKSWTKSRGRDESDVNAINRGRDKFMHIEGDSAARRTGPRGGQTNGTTGIWQLGVLTGINSMNANGNTIWGGISERKS